MGLMSTILSEWLRDSSAIKCSKECRAGISMWSWLGWHTRKSYL